MKEVKKWIFSSQILELQNDVTNTTLPALPWSKSNVISYSDVLGGKIGPKIYNLFSYCCFKIDQYKFRSNLNSFWRCIFSNISVNDDHIVHVILKSITMVEKSSHHNRQLNSQLQRRFTYYQQSSITRLSWRHIVVVEEMCRVWLIQIILKQFLVALNLILLLNSLQQQ